MALQEAVRSISRLAAADLTGSQFLLVDIDSDGKAALAGSTTRVAGVLQNNPDTDQAATVAIAGVTKVISGAAITAGADVGSDAAGKAIAFVAPATGVVAFKSGIALTAAGGADEVIDMLIALSSNEGA